MIVVDLDKMTTVNSQQIQLQSSEDSPIDIPIVSKPGLGITEITASEPDDESMTHVQSPTKLINSALRRSRSPA